MNYKKIEKYYLKYLTTKKNKTNIKYITEFQRI